MEEQKSSHKEVIKINNVWNDKKKEFILEALQLEKTEMKIENASEVKA